MGSRGESVVGGGVELCETLPEHRDRETVKLSVGEAEDQSVGHMVSEQEPELGRDVVDGNVARRDLIYPILLLRSLRFVIQGDTFNRTLKLLQNHLHDSSSVPRKKGTENIVAVHKTLQSRQKPGSFQCPLEAQDKMEGKAPLGARPHFNSTALRVRRRQHCFHLLRSQGETFQNLIFIPIGRWK